MTENPSSEDREDQLEKIAEDFLQRLRLNENPSTAELAKQHPELAPELEKRLKLVESIFKSAGIDESEKTTRERNEQASKVDQTERGNSTVSALSGNFAHRFACPHCGNRVQLVGIAANEVTCGSCGSSLKIARPIVAGFAGIGDSVLPKTLGRFIIKRILGEGAFGIVFLAIDPQLEREVALKTPRNGFFPSLDEERRFFREAKHAASLQHPNIVQVFEVSESEGAPLIVSEYIDGLTLNDVANGNLLSFKESAKLMIQIAYAVEYAHQKGVVHRDLKPGNILLDADRNAYITDFGLAYRDDAEITMTLHGAILGTPAYMAPEQAEGNQKLVGRRSDIYSLGVILYRLATKDLPFHGTKRMLVQQVIHDDPKPPRALNDRIPRDLETIILKAMSKSPEARYQTAAEFAEELQRFLMGEPILARPVSSIARLSRWCVRRPVISALSGSIAALLLVCATLSTLWAVNSDRLKRDAIRVGDLATQNELESKHRLHDLLMNNGVAELKQNELTTSSLWFAEALAISDTANDRIRLAMIHDRIPTLTHLVTGGGPCQTAFSSDGSRFVSANPDSVRVLETQSKKTLFDEQMPGLQFRLSPDGAKLVVANVQDRTNSLALWSVDKRRLIAKIEHTNEIHSFEFDSSSSKLVSCGEDSTAKVSNAIDGTLVAQHSFEGYRVARAAFINNSNSVVLALSQDDEVQCKLVVWDFVQDTLIGKEMLYEAFVSHIRISADGQHLCAGDEDGAIKVWETATGNQVGLTISTNKSLVDAQFTARDKLVIGVFGNGEVATYDFTSGALVYEFFRPIECLSMTQSPDSSILALATTDGQVLFVWREFGVDVCTPINNGKFVHSVAFHPDGHHVAIAGSEGALQLWDLAGSSPNSFVFEHAKTVSDALFIPESNRCVTGSRDGNGYIWDNTTGQRVGEVLQHANAQAISCVAVSSNGKYIATGAIDRRVMIWDSLTGKPVGSALVHDAPITALRFATENSRLFSSDEKGTIRCWEVISNNADERKPIFELQHNAEVSTLRLSHDGKTLASASSEGTIRFWNTSDGLPSSIQLKHGNSRVVFRFFPDDKRIISSGDDLSTVIWDLVTGEPLARLSHISKIWDILVSKDAKMIVLTDLAGNANVWTADDARIFSKDKQFNLGPNVNALGCRLNEDKSILAMAGGKLSLKVDEPFRGAINLWNLADQRQLAPTLRQLAANQHLVLSDDAQHILTRLENSTAQLWKISSTDLPVTDLQRISHLYAQKNSPNTGGGLTLMDTKLQGTEFAELSAKYSAYFTVSEADLKIWEYDIKQNARVAE